MADVRLTATNPEDSSVVPVACDASGRLLLQELPAFDGTLDGDLTVTGKGSFAGGKSIIGNDGSAQFAQGAVEIKANGTTEFTQDVTFASRINGRQMFLDAENLGSNLRLYNTSNATDAVVNQSFCVGSTVNKALITTGLWGGNATSGYLSFSTSLSGTLSTRALITAAGDFRINPSGTAPASDSAIDLKTDGSAQFAGGKAGFTAEGYLWCTTRRGDTVILDATSNGLASWVEYTPTTRIDDIRDGLNAIRGDAAEMPTDTP